MIRHARVFPLIAAALIFASAAFAADSGLFRTIPAETPKKGVFRVTNGSSYGKIGVNSVLTDRYQVEQPRIFSSVTDFELGIVDNLALTVTAPYFADLFSQAGKNGHKAGGGDVSTGLRCSFENPNSSWQQMTLGARFLIPQRFGYGMEPLGFREFSTGTVGWSLESAARTRTGFADLTVSAALYRFPRVKVPNKAGPDDLFYDSGFGYRGIGPADATGFAPTLFQNHLTFSANGSVPITRNTAGVIELSGARFIGKPARVTILRLSPGIRLGNPSGVNMSAGVDVRLKGKIPVTQFLVRLSVPTVSPRAFVRVPGAGRKRITEEQVRARNVPVAIAPFTKDDKTFLYEHDLRDSFARALGAMEVAAVTPNQVVDRAILQESIVPVKDSPERFGVRIGANYLLSADIRSFRSVRATRFMVPYLVSFPKTDFTLTASARVTDLASGAVHELGDITAAVEGDRGMILFPTGPSSDILPLSAPETRRLEKQLIERWVEGLNTRVYERLDLFDWNPKRTPLKGVEETGG